MVLNVIRAFLLMLAFGVVSTGALKAMEESNDFGSEETSNVLPSTGACSFKSDAADDEDDAKETFYSLDNDDEDDLD